MANYESEITQFLKQLKQEKPSLEQEQRDGRARLWDRKVDADQQDEFRAGRVPQKPYVYQTE